MSVKIKVAVDNKIPMLKDVLEPVADVFYYNPFDMTKEAVKDKDALIIRTRTKCSEELLKDSSVKFIATATIGYDHIDTAYCESNNIYWMNAPGCNSSSVMQYISSAIVSVAGRKKLTFDKLTLGIVGVGNVGSKVAKTAKLLGLNVLLNDPPRARKEGNDKFVTLTQLVEQSDIITFHVPLNKTGEDKTFHLADDSFFNSFKEPKIVFNSSRGPVVDNNALKNAIKSGKVSAALLDVWENEPDIDRELLSLVDFATPHIAGYSSDGKANGTAACVNGINEFFKLGMAKNWFPPQIPIPTNPKQIVIECGGKNKQEILTEAILATYKIADDDKTLRNSVETFEKQRGSYPVRREFPYYEIKLSNGNEEIKKILETLGFALV